MKKIISLFLLLTVASVSHARTVELSGAYTGASHFDQVSAGFSTALSLNVLAGLDAKMANERVFKDPVYSVALPLAFDFDFVKFNLRPFYYFENKSDNAAFQNASAFGVQSQLLLTLSEDAVNDLYTQAFIGASFARQEGTVFGKDLSAENKSYSQLAYTLGFVQNFYQAFAFQASGTAYQYPNGITGVAGLRGVMNQQELGRTQTLDIVHDLAKYTLCARLTRMWAENGSTLYGGYHYAEYYTAQPEHSLLVGNSFALTRQLEMDLAYNHVRTVHNKNKRDIWSVRLVLAF